MLVTHIIYARHQIVNFCSIWMSLPLYVCNTANLSKFMLHKGKVLYYVQRLGYWCSTSLKNIFRYFIVVVVYGKYVLQYQIGDQTHFTILDIHAGNCYGAISWLLQFYLFTYLLMLYSTSAEGLIVVLQPAKNTLYSN